MGPEWAYLGAGALALAAGARREGAFPVTGGKAIAGTIFLVILASLSTRTRLAPLVRAIGLVLFLAAAYGAVRAFSTPVKDK